MAIDLDQLTAELASFTAERDWSQFHTPKNLAMALAGEAGELVAEMQWLRPEETERHALSDERLLAIENEIADVLVYLLLLSDRLGVDLETAVKRKMASNRERYGAERFAGTADKAADTDRQEAVRGATPDQT